MSLCSLAPSQLSKYPTLNKLEQSTQVPKAYSTIAVLSTFFTLIFFNIFAGFLSNALGWALPAYLSLRALESPGHEDDTQWLTCTLLSSRDGSGKSSPGLGIPVRCPDRLVS